MTENGVELTPVQQGPETLRKLVKRQAGVYIAKAEHLQRKKFSEFSGTDDMTALEDILHAVNLSGGIGYEFLPLQKSDSLDSGTGPKELEQETLYLLNHVQSFEAIFNKMQQLSAKYPHPQHVNVVSETDWSELRADLLNLEHTIQQLSSARSDSHGRHLSTQYDIDRQEFELVTNRHSVYFYVIEKWLAFLRHLL